jgi:hypothetical protein
MITWSFLFQLHFISKTQPSKFTFINTSFSRYQAIIQATTEAQVPVQQARVSHAHLSQTLIFISVLDNTSKNSTFVFLGKISMLFSIGFQYFSRSKLDNSQGFKNITACGFHILIGVNLNGLSSIFNINASHNFLAL